MRPTISPFKIIYSTGQRYGQRKEGMMSLMIPISWGELFDKLTILKIKQQRVFEKSKLENIRRELSELVRIRDEQAKMTHELEELVAGLSRVNAQLWDIEDEIRKCERDGEFSGRFIELARSVYKTNDQRAQLKYLINELLGSDLVEEKSYQPYQ